MSTQLSLLDAAPAVTPASTSSWADRSARHAASAGTDPTICLDCNRGDRTTAKPFCPSCQAHLRVGP